MKDNFHETSSDRDTTLADADVVSFFKDNFDSLNNKIDYSKLLDILNSVESTKSRNKKKAYNLSFKDKDINYIKDILSNYKQGFNEVKNKSGVYDKSYSSFRKTFMEKERLANLETKKIKLSTENDNLFRRILDSNNIVQNPESIAKNMFWNEQSIEVKNRLHNQYSLNENDAKFINKFVDSLKDDKTKYVRKNSKGKDSFQLQSIRELFKGSNFDDEDIKKIVGTYVKENKKTASGYKNYVKSKDTLLRAIGDKMLDPKEIIKNHKTSNDDPYKVTVEDILKNKDKFANTLINISDKKNIDLIEELEKLVKKDESLKDVIVDNDLKKDKNGIIYSTKMIKDKLYESGQRIKEIPLAKALKIDALIPDKKSNIVTFEKGTIDRTLSAFERGDGTVGRLKNTYFHFDNKFYKEDKDGTIKEVEELRDYKVVSGKKGTTSDLLKSLMGEGKGSKQDASFFDIRSKYGPNKKDNISSFLNRYSNREWEGNILNSLLGDKDIYDKLHNGEDLTNDEYQKSVKYMSKLNKIFKDATTGISEEGIERLKENAGADLSYIFDLTKDSPEEALNELTAYSMKDIKNRDLAGIITSFKTDRNKLLSRVEEKTNNLAAFESKKNIGIEEILNRELTKEAILRMPEGKAKDIIEKSNLNKNDSTMIKRLLAWTKFQDETGSSGYATDFQEESQLRDSLSRLYDLMDKDDDFEKTTHETISSMFNKFSKGVYNTDKFTFGQGYEDDIVVKKAVTILDAINDETKRKAFFKQFNAGMKDPENITTATLVPYYFANKLNKSLDSVGLSLSGNDVSSTGELMLNLGVKRLLPGMLALKGLSYLDYRMEAYTGTSMMGAAANVAANTDLGVRRIFDATGVSDNLKSQREYNPILRYVFGKKYMNHNERSKWYRDGYSPVREGRYWSFMSLNEFRGGKVNYFQPNWLKRAHSNAYDISVYGSQKEKWKYSWLPTPRHPFSPLARIFDPYRLERRHYMDRPYNVSGDAFGHDVPGSALLNMTVGRLLKPGTAMHTRTTLKRSLFDSRSVIDEQNRMIRERANSNLIQLDKHGDIVPVSYNSLKPYGTQDINIKIENNKINVSTTTYDERPGMEADDFEEAYTNTIESKRAILNSGVIRKDGKFGIKDILQKEIRDSIGNPFYDIKMQYDRQETTSINQINKLNKEILNKANQVEKGFITKDGLPSVSRASAGTLFDSQTMSDLRNTTSTETYLDDLAYHATGMAGMHGFVFKSLFPRKRRSRFADASMMESHSRRFWDLSLGGLGGRPAHALRKFLPHEDHSVNKISTIRNTMPEWMPNRFKYGDPYTMLPKGEMRLPGSGYESMFDLHPDQYGERYGSFDRMRILGDIAPWSQEYKMWRDIANKEVQDPNLRKEMQAIKDRVEEQSKKHDFYHYRFLGQKTDSKEVTIESVFEGNKFTVRGDSQIYRLGKIEQMSEEAKQIFHAGMTVRMTTGRDEADDVEAKAAIIHDERGTNINKKLLKSDLAIEGKTETVIDARATLDGSQIFKGKLWEAVAHADIPIIHKKFMNINDPLESYKQERVYGTTHSTWSNPIKGWIAPALREASSVGMVRHALGLGSWYYAEMMNDQNSKASELGKIGSIAAFGLLNKGAVAGGIIASIPNMGLDFDVFMKGARLGAMAQELGFTFANKNNVIKSTTGLAVAGSIIGNQLFSNEISGAALGGAKVGAALGLLLSGMNSSIFNKGYNSPYIPKSLEKRWEIDEYYDRLKYVKYKGLYEKASRLAKRHEGVDIKNILELSDEDKEESEKLRQELMNSRDKISNSYSEGDSERERMLQEINHKIALLDSPEAIIKGGDYTKSAVAYKQAMDSTIYGLNENSNWTQILRALPKDERDYMLEFAKVQDEKKRKEIYNLVSPYQRKILDIAWGKSVSKQKSNLSYFMNHNISNGFWSGWKTTTDLEQVKLKTIQNEGMLLSDFGHYESELEDPNYQYAPEVMNIKSKPFNALKNAMNLMHSMSGVSLSVRDVSVTPSNSPGIKTRVNILQSRTNELKREMAKKLRLPYYG